jgi:poly(A) polymerase
VNDPLTHLSAIVPDAWLVGGALRDQLLERETSDYDVVLPPAGDQTVEQTARALGRSAGGVAFALSDAFGAWRVVDHRRRWQIDLNPLEGETIESDLVRRDLTVNAIAQPLGQNAPLVDPSGGLSDLHARRLRAVAADAFERDPLRTLRLARLAAELAFMVEPETLALARTSAARLADVAVERVFAELRRLLSCDRALEGLALMDAAMITDVVLPELAALRGVEQSRFHHLDVYDHTRAVLAETIALQADPEPVFEAQTPALLAFLALPLANDLTRGQAMRFGALLHDIAKPQTRDTTPEGRVTFMRHDVAGAQLAVRILSRLRASERLSEHVGALTRHHLRLGFLVHSMPLDRREVYRYLDTCAPVAVDVTVLSVADRLATRGDNADRAITRHLELAQELLAAGLDWQSDPPRPPVRGDELAAALAIRPGPRLGELLHELEEAAYAGEVGSSEEAIAFARQRIDPQA